ncbi:hypothetical protein BV898_11669 [Hypsibius exemplaris]|uniref:Uncharacterized protein n=1 Tax=Hypsibius exemplaris TaxID=2072580 RepID=A0A1W0WFW6_HYPEX|nr:hypothetical protein BV898_11669 [Hypsibius exemplaris]
MGAEKMRPVAVKFACKDDVIQFETPKMKAVKGISADGFSTAATQRKRSGPVAGTIGEAQQLSAPPPAKSHALHHHHHHHRRLKHAGPPTLSPLQLCFAQMINDLQRDYTPSPPAAQKHTVTLAHGKIKPSGGQGCKLTTDTHRPAVYLPGNLYHIYEEVPRAAKRKAVTVIRPSISGLVPSSTGNFCPAGTSRKVLHSIPQNCARLVR